MALTPTITRPPTENIELARYLESALTSLRRDVIDSILSGPILSGNIIPATDNSYDLGSSTYKWKDIHVDGTAYMDTLTDGTATLTGGNFTTTGTGRFDGGISAGADSPAPEVPLYFEGTSATARSISLKNLGSGDCQLSLYAGSYWLIGVDNSDGDTLKFSQDGSEIGTNTRFAITTAGAITGGTYNEVTISKAAASVAISANSAVDQWTTVGVGEFDAQADGFDLYGGTQSRVLTVTGGNWTIDQNPASGSNVTWGTIGCGEVTIADGSSINLQEAITFTGATAENLIEMPDNLADALSIKEAGNAYMTFDTSNADAKIVLGKNLTTTGAITQSGAGGILWSVCVTSENEFRADNDGTYTNDPTQPPFTFYLATGTGMYLQNQGAGPANNVLGLAVGGGERLKISTTLATLSAGLTLSNNNDITLGGTGHITSGSEGFIVGTLTITDGSIDDTDGTINFGATNLTNIGTLASGIPTFSLANSSLTLAEVEWFAGFAHNPEIQATSDLLVGIFLQDAVYIRGANNDPYLTFSSADVTADASITFIRATDILQFTGASGGYTFDDDVTVSGVINTTSSYEVDGTKVVGNQGAHVADASTQDIAGSDTVDEAKLESDLTNHTTAINAILSALETHGLLANA